MIHLPFYGAFIAVIILLLRKLDIRECQLDKLTREMKGIRQSHANAEMRCSELRDREVKALGQASLSNLKLTRILEIITRPEETNEPCPAPLRGTAPGSSLRPSSNGA